MEDMIGLEIASNAVMAVEMGRLRHGIPHLSRSRSRGLEGDPQDIEAATHDVLSPSPDVRHILSLRSFGAEPLPLGAVVGGIVMEPEVVTQAIKRLWEQQRFSSKQVVVGVSGSSAQVVIRQRLVDQLSAADFRQQLDFEADQLVSMSPDDAVIDFAIVQDDLPATHLGGSPQMRVLLAAADRDLIQSTVDVVRLGGLEPVAVVPSALAAATALSRSRASVGDEGATERTDAVVVIGSDVLTFAVVAGAQPIFVRSEVITQQDDGSPNQIVSTAASFINRSITYVQDSESVEVPEMVYVTGSTIESPGLLDQLKAALSIPVSPLRAYDGVDLTLVGGSIGDYASTLLTNLVAVGLAEWTAQDGPLSRLSLLPPEVIEHRERVRYLKAAAAVIALVAVVLGAVTYKVQREGSVYAADNARVAAQRAAIDAQIAHYQPVASYITGVNQRTTVAQTAIKGATDWSALLHQIAAVTPSNLAMTAFNVTVPTSTTPNTPAAPPAVPTSTTPNTPAAPPAVPTVTMTVAGTGDESAVAQWLDAMGKVPALSAATVSSSQVSNGKVTFTCTADLSHPPIFNRTIGAH